MRPRRSAAARAPRVVFDTAVLLQALLGASAAAQGLRQAWQDGACQALVDAGSARALMLALGAPALGLSAAQQQELLADFLPYAQVLPSADEKAGASRLLKGLPVLQRQALTLARQGRARWLVSDSGALSAHIERSRIARPLEFVGSEKFLTRL